MLIYMVFTKCGDEQPKKKTLYGRGHEASEFVLPGRKARDKMKGVI